jgi:hypothetical protein
MGVSVNIADYEKLIYKMAHRAMRRLTSAGIFVEIEEIAQEGREIFARAAGKYDPTRQVKFSTYLYGALNNSLNRFCDKQCDAFFPGVSLTDTMGEDGSSYIDVIADQNAQDPAELLERRETAARNLAGFEAETRDVLIALMAPSDALKAEVARLRAFRKEARKHGFGAPQVSFGVEAIMMVMGYDDKTKRLVRADIKDFMAAQ